MNKKTLIVFTLLLILANLNLYSEINFTLDGEIQTSPWLYESSYEMHCISFSTAWMAGINLDWFTLGLNIFSDYVSVNGNKESNQFKGAWFNVGGTIMSIFEINNRMTLTIGAGYLWNKSSFDFDDLGWVGKEVPGFEIIAGSIFTLSESVQLELISRLDLFFSPNNSIEDINYLLGIRTHINPGIQWLTLYGELNTFYWSYKNKYLLEGIDTWMFQAQVGVSIHLGNKKDENTIPDTGLDEEIQTLPDETTELSNNLITTNDDDEKKKNDPGLNKLKKSKAGDEISFDSIHFNNEEITNESLPVLDGIAEILMENKTIIISIKGYAKFMLDPIKELELCKTRANRIMKYLVNKGVEPIQVQLNPTGNIITNNEARISIIVIANDQVDISEK